jgi:flagellar hook-associated protein 3 FlgL
MRVSERMRYSNVQRRVEDAKEGNAHALDRLSSQKEITKLSDNPVGATQIIRFRDSIEETRQYQKNIDYSKGYLERTEGALSGIADNLIRAKELAITMNNDTYDAASREATSREVREIMEEIVSMGNSTFSGKYVFGGFRNQTPPVSMDGDYLGDDGAIYIQVSPGNFRQINLQARSLFESTQGEQEAGHFNMIHALELLHEGLTSNNKDMLQKSLSEIDFHLNKTTSYQATIGGIWNAVNDTQDRLQSEEVLSRTKLSKVQDTDFYDASSEFRRTEVVLQGTMMASTKLLQPSLLNFLQ